MQMSGGLYDLRSFALQAQHIIRADVVVSSKGVVKALKPGKVKITVKTANGKKATVTITVKK